MNKEKLLDENSKHALQSDNIIAITNRHLCSRPFMEQLERVCKLHPHAIVLREKDMPEAEYLSLARDVIALCKKYDVQCMLHSFINVAMELEHPYIHLPLPILEAYVKKNVSGNISTGMCCMCWYVLYVLVCAVCIGLCWYVLCVLVCVGMCSVCWYVLCVLLF